MTRELFLIAVLLIIAPLAMICLVVFGMLFNITEDAEWAGMAARAFVATFITTPIGYCALTFADEREAIE